MTPAGSPGQGPPAVADYSRLNYPGCGKRPSFTRAPEDVIDLLIHGGSEADPEEVPWIASLRYCDNGKTNCNNPKHLCGGTLVTDRYVVACNRELGGK